MPSSLFTYFIHLGILLSGIEVRPRIATVEDATLPKETDLLSKLPEMTLRHTAQSEGYETMMQHSLDIVSEVNRILCAFCSCINVLFLVMQCVPFVI